MNPMKEYALELLDWHKDQIAEECERAKRAIDDGYYGVVITCMLAIQRHEGAIVELESFAK